MATKKKAAPAAKESPVDETIDPVTGKPWTVTVNGEEVTGDEARAIVLDARAEDEKRAAESLKPAEPVTGLGEITALPPEQAPGYQGGVPAATQARIDAVSKSKK